MITNAGQDAEKILALAQSDTIAGISDGPTIVRMIIGPTGIKDDRICLGRRNSCGSGKRLKISNVRPILRILHSNMTVKNHEIRHNRNIICVGMS
jgi:hypothetical protein